MSNHKYYGRGSIEMLYKELQEGEHVLLFATSNTLKRFPPVENALLLQMSDSTRISNRIRSTKR